ncbi:MAG: hypothetical protein ACW99U_18105 [Candidatus Thorarchaeota archaeon]|jgi:hypothetical protein
MSESSNDEDNPRQRGRPGRPPVTKSQADLPSRAVKLRSEGYSWSQISSILKVGRSSIRRVVLAHQNNDMSETDTLPDTCISIGEILDCQDEDNRTGSSLTDNDVLDGMPRTFQIFSSLLEKVRELDDENP